MNGYEDWESKPGDFTTGGIAFSESDLKRSRAPRKRRYPFGFQAQVSIHDTAGSRCQRNRHHNTVRRG